MEEMKHLVVEYALEMFQKELIKLYLPNFEKMSKDEKKNWLDKFLFENYFYELKYSFSDWMKEKPNDSVLILQMLQYWVDFVDEDYNIKKVPNDDYIVNKEAGIFNNTKEELKKEREKETNFRKKHGFDY
jgi:hypothetical protein